MIIIFLFQVNKINVSLLKNIYRVIIFYKKDSIDLGEVKKMKVIEKSIFTENGNIDFLCLLRLLEEERFNYIIPKKLLKQIIGNKDFLTRINPFFKNDEEYILIDIENIPGNYLDKYGNKIPNMLIRLVNTKKYVVSKKLLFNNVQEYLNNNKSMMSVNEIKWCNRFFDMYYKKKKNLSQNLFSSTYSLNFPKYIELLEKDYFNYIIPERAIHEILNSKELFEFFINNNKSASNNIEFDNDFKELWIEYDNVESKEADFIKQVDKLEAALQALSYGLSPGVLKCDDKIKMPCLVEILKEAYKTFEESNQ